MHTNDIPVSVACYCRVSTENQIENYSIDEQKERLEAFCKARGWGKPTMFIDRSSLSRTCSTKTT